MWLQTYPARLMEESVLVAEGSVEEVVTVTNPLEAFESVEVELLWLSVVAEGVEVGNPLSTLPLVLIVIDTKLPEESVEEADEPEEVGLAKEESVEVELKSEVEVEVRFGSEAEVEVEAD